MSDETAPITVTLKAGTGYDSPWLVIRGDSPDDVTMKLDGLGGVIASTIEAANLFKGAGNAAPVAQGSPALAAVPEQPKAAWGQAKPAQQSQNGNGQKSFGQQHPEGTQCGVCGNVLERKTTQGGKAKWQCPDWRWNNGNPNGHDMEWINN